MTGSKPDWARDSILYDLSELFSGRGGDDSRRRVREALVDPENPVSFLFRRPVKDRPFSEDWPPPDMLSFIDSENATDRESIHEAQPQSVPRQKPSWLAIPLNWENKQAETTVAFAAILLAMVHRRVRLLPSTQFSKGVSAGTAETDSETDQIHELLERGDPLIAADSSHWIHTAVENDCLLVRVGRDSAVRFERFSLEFRRGDKIVLRLEAERGVVRINRDDFARVAAASDNLTIEEMH